MNTSSTKIPFLLFIFCWLSHWGYAQSWHNHGPAEVTAGGAGYPSLALDPTGTPYLAYQNVMTANSGAVIKYNGSSWVDVGVLGYAVTGTISQPKIVVDATATPLFAYIQSGSIICKKYDGSSWVNLESPGRLAVADFSFSLVLDANSTPYVIFADGVNGGKATVKKYNGSSWITVGSAGFSAGKVNYTSLAFDPNGLPYVSYKDDANGYKATVRKFDGSSWVDVGTPGFSAGIASNTCLRMDATGTPYVAYLDATYSYGAVVMKYNSTSWEAVGAAGFTGIWPNYIDLALDANGTPFVAYRDPANGGKMTVRKYIGEAWTVVGTAGFSAGMIRFPNLVFDEAGTLFAAYNDESYYLKATVMKFAAQGLAIATQPVAATITGGQNASFTVMASGGGTLTYQWQVSRDGGASFSNIPNGGVYSGAATATLTLTKAPISMNGYQYRVQVSDGTTTTSNAVALTVNVPAFDNTRVWQVAGTAGFSAGAASYTSLSVDAAGTSFVAYMDEANGNKATVKKFTGGSWETVGTGALSEGAAYSTRIVLDATGTPLVAYIDVANGSKATVKRFTGSSWVEVGAPGFSAGGAADISLALDANSNPYVVYRDVAHGNKATVKRFTDNSWVDVGTPGFSAGEVYYTRLALDANGSPFVAYKDYGNGEKVTVRKYDGSSWVNVGAAGFSSEGAADISLALDADGTPFVAYMDFSNVSTVRKYDGSSWVEVGAGGISATIAPGTSLALDAAGTPLVAFQDWANGNKVTVVKFNGTRWIMVGIAGFSAGMVSNTNLALDETGAPVVVYRDWANNNQATVMKFAARPPEITTGALAAAAYCAGAPVSVPFTTTGTFNANNTFTAQLSDAAGSFAAPTTIGSGTASPIAASLPANVAVGSGYRIRIVASALLVAGTDNSTNVTIKSVPVQPGTITGAATICPGQTETYAVAALGAATAYTWTVPADWQITSGQGTASITVTTGTTAGQIAVTASNDCGQSTARTLAVALKPAVEDNIIAADQIICLGAAPQALAGSTPIGGNGSLAYLWESSTSSATTGFAPAPGVNNEKDYSPSAGLQLTTWFRRRAMADNCPATATYSNAIQIKVLTKPAAPTTLAVAQCGPGTVTLTAAGAGSNDSYRWYTSAAGGAPIAGATDGTFITPALTGTATYYVSVVSVAGCESERMAVTAAINPIPVVTAGDNGTACIDAPSFSLTGFSPAGGSWSGPGVTAAGLFMPAVAGVGTHTLTYRVTQDGCTGSATRTITVQASPAVSLTPFTDICSSNTSLALTGGQPAGGIWLGTGVTNGIFNAAVAGVGTHTITYSFTDASGCAASASQNITVTTCTGMEEDETASDWSLYPNPTPDKIKVELSVKVKTNMVFKIVRTDGSVVLEKAFPQVVGTFKQVFDLKGQAKGLYLLQQITDQGMVTKQIVLQ